MCETRWREARGHALRNRTSLTLPAGGGPLPRTLHRPAWCIPLPHRRLNGHRASRHGASSAHCQTHSRTRSHDHARRWLTLSLTSHSHSLRSLCSLSLSLSPPAALTPASSPPPPRRRARLSPRRSPPSRASPSACPAHRGSALQPPRPGPRHAPSTRPRQGP